MMGLFNWLFGSKTKSGGKVSRVSLTGSKQWAVKDWWDVLSMTATTTSAKARLKWLTGKVATTRSVRLVRVASGSVEVLDSETGLPTSGDQMLNGEVSVGDQIKLQVKATGAQQASCMIRSSTMIDDGTYIETV